MIKNKRNMKNFNLAIATIGAAAGAILMMGGNNMGLFLLLIGLIANLNTY